MLQIIICRAFVRSVAVVAKEMYPPGSGQCNDKMQTA